PPARGAGRPELPRVADGGRERQVLAGGCGEGRVELAGVIDPRPPARVGAHLGGDRCAARGLARRGGRARAAVRASRPRHADVERLRRQRPAGARSLGDRRGALVRGRAGLGGRGARAGRSAGEGGVTRRLDARIWLVVLPAATVLLASGAYALLSDASPSRLHLTSSWAGPSLSRPLGSGEAGVD